MAQQRSSSLNQIRCLWGHLSIRRRGQLVALGFLMVATSFAEVGSIGAVLPFLGALTAPEKIFTNEFAQPLILLLRLQTPRDLLIPFTFAFTLAVIIAGLARITLLWFQTRLSMAIGSDFSVQVYERTLYQPYSLHLSRNSSEILAGSQKAKELVGFIIQPVLMVLSSVVILLAVLAALFVIQPVIALSALAGFGLIYVLVVTLTKRSIANNSQIIAAQQIRVTKAIQEGLGGIREVLIDASQPVYARLYRNAFIPMQTAIASNQVIGASPRFGIEALGMVLIAGLAYVLASAGNEADGLTATIPVLGAMAMGAQRLLPVLQQIYSAYITIKGNQASTQDALHLLDQSMPEGASAPPATPMPFRTAIKLNDISFRYSSEGPWVFKHLTLEIPKGCKIGFVGTTGSGKSTLLDILTCLLEPTEGNVFVDGVLINAANVRAWQAHIAQVPQTIFLADASVMENIAFGIPPQQIDLKRVKLAAQKAQIAQTIEGWIEGYGTLVGEQGVRLSGGQRQRIGIARALYKRANVFIFDEATSALDEETESDVMRAIENLGNETTVLIISHRLSTLKNCDLIFELTNGFIRLRNDFDHLLKRPH